MAIYSYTDSDGTQRIFNLDQVTKVVLKRNANEVGLIFAENSTEIVCATRGEAEAIFSDIHDAMKSHE